MSDDTNNAIPDLCPDCARPKAGSLLEVMKDYCPKHWAIFDHDAERDCQRVAAQQRDKGFVSEKLDAARKASTPTTISWAPTAPMCGPRHATLAFGQMLAGIPEGFGVSSIQVRLKEVQPERAPRLFLQSCSDGTTTLFRLTEPDDGFPVVEYRKSAVGPWVVCGVTKDDLEPRTATTSNLAQEIITEHTPQMVPATLCPHDLEQRGIVTREECSALDPWFVNRVVPVVDKCPDFIPDLHIAINEVLSDTLKQVGHWGIGWLPPVPVGFEAWAYIGQGYRKDDSEGKEVLARHPVHTAPGFRSAWDIVRTNCGGNDDYIYLRAINIGSGAHAKAMRANDGAGWNEWEKALMFQRNPEEAKPHPLDALKQAPHRAAHNQACDLILSERNRQVLREGWSPEHDDKHNRSELALAAASYLIHTSYGRGAHGSMPSIWPFCEKWWKPSSDPKRDLVKGLALGLAELERILRAEAPFDAPVPVRDQPLAAEPITSIRQATSLLSGMGKLDGITIKQVVDALCGIEKVKRGMFTPTEFRETVERALSSLSPTAKP